MRCRGGVGWAREGRLRRAIHPTPPTHPVPPPDTRMPSTLPPHHKMYPHPGRLTPRSPRPGKAQKRGGDLLRFCGQGLPANKNENPHRVHNTRPPGEQTATDACVCISLSRSAVSIQTHHSRAGVLCRAQARQWVAHDARCQPPIPQPPLPPLPIPPTHTSFPFDTPTRTRRARGIKPPGARTAACFARGGEERTWQGAAHKPCCCCGGRR